jgi:hypothetical protein
MDQKKVKFTPVAKSHDVDISVFTRTTYKTQWSAVPGADHLTRMSLILFTDLNPS